MSSKPAAPQSKCGAAGTQTLPIPGCLFAGSRPHRRTTP